MTYYDNTRIEELRYIDNIVRKLRELKIKISLCSEPTIEFLEFGGSSDKEDIEWVDKMIREYDGTGVVIEKNVLRTANLLWKKYSNLKHDYDWREVDEHLIENRKIHAIKIYRNKMGTSLRTAKDAIDARVQLLEAKEILSHGS